MNIHTGQLTQRFRSTEEIQKMIKAQGGIIYYSNLMLEEYGYSKDSQKVRRSEYKNGKSPNYKHFTSQNGDGETIHWYDSTKIPSATFEKFNLPSIIESSKHFSLDFQNHIQLHETGDQVKSEFLEVILLGAIDRAYKFESLFLKNLEFATEAKLLSQKYAILLESINYIKNPISVIKDLHLILNTSPFAHLRFPTKLKSFYAYIRRAAETEDLVRFVFGKWNVSDNARKLNGKIIELVCYYAAHPNGAISRDKVRIWVNVMITAFPNLNGKRRLTIRTVENCIINHKNQIDIYRDGEERVRKVYAGYLHMACARNPMDQFFMDEWYIDLVCKVSNKKIRKIVIGIMDGCSQKMIDHKSVGVINKEVVKEFLGEVLVKCRNRMPAELICDFASYNVCKDISRMFDYLVYKYKGKFAWTTTSNANRKVEIERFWRTMGSYYISTIVGAIGNGITAERDNAHPAKVITLFLNDPAFLEDELEVDRIVDHIFQNYNKKGIHRDVSSPNEVFRDNPHPNSVSLAPVDIAFMHGICESRKLLRSQVTIESKDYQLFEDSVVPFTGKDVDCYCHHDFPGRVFVFALKSFNFIGEFIHYQDIPKAKVNQTPEDLHRLSKMVEKQNSQVEAILEAKQKGLATIMTSTGQVDPGHVAMFLIDQNLPEKSTSVSHLNPNAIKKIEINPFNLPDRKEAKRAGTNKRVASPVSSEGLLTDNVKKKYA